MFAKSQGKQPILIFRESILALSLPVPALSFLSTKSETGYFFKFLAFIFPPLYNTRRNKKKENSTNNCFFAAKLYSFLSISLFFAANNKAKTVKKKGEININNADKKYIKAQANIRENFEKELYAPKSDTKKQKDNIYPVKTVYYEDELKDEFSVSNIKTLDVDENYPFLRKGFFFHAARFVVYRLIALPIAYVFCKLTLNHKTVGRKNLRKTKGSYFLYANHTQQTADAFIPTLACFPKSVYTIVHRDNISIDFLGKFTPYLGAIPIPNSMRALRNFNNAIEKRTLENKCIAIYPEAHIWPYATFIRNFPDTSFYYPVEYDTPVYSMTTVYKKRRFFKKPQAVSYIDGPFFVNHTLPRREAIKDLRDRVYAKMCERSRESDCTYIEYIKKED